MEKSECSPGNLCPSSCLKTVFHLDGNKLKASLKGNDSVTELVDPNTLTTVSRSNAECLANL